MTLKSFIEEQVKKCSAWDLSEDQLLDVILSTIVFVEERTKLEKGTGITWDAAVNSVAASFEKLREEL
mgnify:CR=1 FL=1